MQRCFHMACAGLLALLALVAAGCDLEDRRPDLVFDEAPTIEPSAPVAGQTVIMSFRVANTGRADAEASIFRIYRSGAGLVAEAWLPALSRGQRSPIQQIAIVETAGTHTYTIVLDSWNTIQEGADGEANNEVILIVEVAPVAAG